MRHCWTILLPFLLVSCAQEGGAQDPIPGTTWVACDGVPEAFALHVHDVLADSSGMFKGDYPDATPLTCELLDGLQEAMKDDSVRYHFEHLSQRYWARGSHYHDAERYIKRHMDFHLSIAATAHFFEDIRIMGLRELYDYRRSRPMVCATREHIAQLERQDKQAVRYLLHVVEETPLHIDGSENSTIHGVYMGEVMHTLDLFTGQDHHYDPDTLLRIHVSEAGLATAMADWRKWLER